MIADQSKHTAMSSELAGGQRSQSSFPRWLWVWGQLGRPKIGRVEGVSLTFTYRMYPNLGLSIEGGTCNVRLFPTAAPLGIRRGQKALGALPHGIPMEGAPSTRARARPGGAPASSSRVRHMQACERPAPAHRLQSRPLYAAAACPHSSLCHARCRPTLGCCRACACLCAGKVYAMASHATTFAPSTRAPRPVQTCAPSTRRLPPAAPRRPWPCHDRARRASPPTSSDPPASAHHPHGHDGQRAIQSTARSTLACALSPPPDHHHHHHHHHHHYHHHHHPTTTTTAIPVRVACPRREALPADGRVAGSQHKRPLSASTTTTPTATRRVSVRGAASTSARESVSPQGALAAAAAGSPDTAAAAAAGPAATPRSTSPRIAASPTPSDIPSAAAPSPLPTPTPFAPPTRPSAAISSPPDRKIWMRACNNCGHALHVRRTKCTECGTLQTSKRALAETEREAERAAVRAQEQEASATASRKLHEEAQEAASQLAKMVSSSDDDGAAASCSPVASALALLVSAEARASGTVAADIDGEASAPVAPATPIALAAPASPAVPAAPVVPAAIAAPRSPVPSSARRDADSPAATAAALANGTANGTTSMPAQSPALAQALARLTPQQLTKLRRMHKLRALLAHLPAGVAPPIRGRVAAAKAAAATTTPAAAAAAAAVAPPPADEDGAISILASVACM